ncbi:MAG: hypothetical protein HKN70_10685 [Gammaproteobacteria bacterium]|nr:hypothetical protein [Gammaproteobacteria bacterium]
MNGRRIIGVCAVIVWAYAAWIFWQDYQHSQTYPREEREVISQPGPVSFGATDITVIEAPALSSDDFVQARLTLNIGSEYFTADDEAWIDTRADPDDYRARYLERFDMGYLTSDASRRLYIVETLQGEYALADEPLVNLWSIDELGHIASLMAVTPAQAHREPAWAAVFARSHAAAPRAIPAMAAMVLGLGLMLPLMGRFWREGSWGIICALAHFLVPIIGGAPLLAAPGLGYLVPAVALAFVVTAAVGAALARWWRKLQLESLALRALGICLVPCVTLLTGVLAAVGLAAGFALLVDNSGGVATGQNFTDGLLRPTVLLLRTGVGVAVLLMLTGGLYQVFMARKMRRSQTKSV